MSQNNAINEFLTVAEVSKLLRISNLTLYKYIKEGKIAVLELGGHYRISKTSLNSFISDHIVEVKEENYEK